MKIGDRVFLSGVKMTVMRLVKGNVFDSSGIEYATCVWFDNEDHLQMFDFPVSIFLTESSDDSPQE